MKNGRKKKGAKKKTEDEVDDMSEEEEDVDVYGFPLRLIDYEHRTPIPESSFPKPRKYRVNIPGTRHLEDLSLQELVTIRPTTDFLMQLGEEIEKRRRIHDDEKREFGYCYEDDITLPTLIISHIDYGKHFYCRSCDVVFADRADFFHHLLEEDHCWRSVETEMSGNELMTKFTRIWHAHTNRIYGNPIHPYWNLRKDRKPAPQVECWPEDISTHEIYQYIEEQIIETNCIRCKQYWIFYKLFVWTKFGGEDIVRYYLRMNPRHPSIALYLMIEEEETADEAMIKKREEWQMGYKEKTFGPQDDIQYDLQFPSVYTIEDSIKKRVDITTAIFRPVPQSVQESLIDLNLWQARRGVPDAFCKTHEISDVELCKPDTHAKSWPLFSHERWLTWIHTSIEDQWLSKYVREVDDKEQLPACYACGLVFPDGAVRYFRHFHSAKHLRAVRLLPESQEKQQMRAYTFLARWFMRNNDEVERRISEDRIRRQKTQEKKVAEARRVMAAASNKGVSEWTVVSNHKDTRPQQIRVEDHVCAGPKCPCKTVFGDENDDKSLTQELREQKREAERKQLTEEEEFKAKKRDMAKENLRLKMMNAKANASR